MTLKEFTSGINTSFSSELNSNFNASLTTAHLSRIDQLRIMQDSGIVERGNSINTSRDIFSDSTGYSNKVDTGNTTAIFVHDRYVPIPIFSGDTITSSTDGSFANISNFFDNEGTNAAVNSRTVSGTAGSTLGRTFSIRYITDVYIKISLGVTNGSGNNEFAFLESYNGSTWDSEVTLISTTSSSGTYTGIISLNKSIQGIRVRFSTTSADSPFSHTHNYYQIYYNTANFNTGVITTESLLTGDTYNSIFLTGSCNNTDAITYDVSVDGGSTWLTTGLSFNTINALLSTGTDLAIRFNLSTSEDATMYGFSGVVGTQ